MNVEAQRPTPRPVGRLQLRWPVADTRQRDAGPRLVGIRRATRSEIRCRQTHVRVNFGHHRAMIVSAPTYQVDVDPDVWTVLTALGTSSAVAVALGIAIWSSRKDRRSKALENARQRRQITAVARVRANRRDVVVDLINGSSDLIVHPTISIEMANGPDARRWFWNDELRPPFLRPQDTYHGNGGFFEIKDGVISRDHPIQIPEPVPLHVMLAWQDAYGVWWGRWDGGEPFRTSPAMPGRDVDKFVSESYRWWQVTKWQRNRLHPKQVSEAWAPEQ